MNIATRTIKIAMRGLRGPTGQTGVSGQFSVLLGTDALKAVPTVGIVDKAYFVREDGTLTVWQLKAGNTIEDLVGGVARPTDFADVTNEKIFTREL